MRTLVPTGLSDLIIFESLKQSLDVSTQCELQQARESDRALKYEKFWSQLKAKRDKATPFLQRQEWENVVLKNSSQNLTFADWRVYQAEFELKLSRVSDTTENEVYQKILQQLPVEWQDSVIRESVERSQKTFWVRITGHGTLPAKTLAQYLNDTFQMRITNTRECPGSILLNTHSERGEKQLLTLNGCLLNGNILNVSQTRVQMSARNIFEFVAQKLQIQEEVAQSTSHLSLLPPVSRRLTNIIYTEEAALSPTPGTPEGRRRVPGGDERDSHITNTLVSESGMLDPTPLISGSNPPSHVTSPIKTPREPRKGCYECKAKGLPHNHQQFTCPVWQKAYLQCFVCRFTPRNADHPYWTCPYYSPSRRPLPFRLRPQT
jgi:hypothetical protein